MKIISVLFGNVCEVSQFYSIDNNKTINNMNNNYKVSIIIVTKLKEQVTIERIVNANSNQAAALRAEEFFEAQGFTGFATPLGLTDDNMPYDII